MSMKRLWAGVCMAMIALGAYLPALADESLLADGNAWVASSEPEKEAYLYGVGNMMTVEYIVQDKATTAPTDEQSSIRRWWNALEAVDVEEVMARVDAWYAANPDKLAEPVLVVIWNEYVE